VRDNDNIILESLYGQMLQEAPIGDVSRLSDYFGKTEKGDDDPKKKLNKSEKLREVDINLMRSEKYAKYLKDNFFKKIPFVIDIIFNDPHIRQGGEWGPNNEYLTMMRAIKPNRQRIKAIIGNNPFDYEDGREGNKILTPWIIAHRMAHALFQMGSAYRGDVKKYGSIRKDYVSENVGQYYSSILDTVEEYFEKINPNFKEEGDVITEPHFGIFYNYPKMYKLVSKFKSAREEKVTNIQEYIFELFAEYLTKGRIDFNPVPDEKTSNAYAKKIEDYMIETLKLAKGGIIEI
jgi:hypothetical protein